MDGSWSVPEFFVAAVWIVSVVAILARLGRQ